MARSINKVVLVGQIGRDPDVQTTNAGSKVAYVSLATTRRIARVNEQFAGSYEDRTEWHRLTLWDKPELVPPQKLATLAEDYVRKGDRVYVEGRIEYDSFEKNGVTIPTSEIMVTDLVLLGSPRTSAFASGDDLD